jgi:hypothetical protein
LVRISPRWLVQYYYGVPRLVLLDTPQTTSLPLTSYQHSRSWRKLSLFISLTQLDSQAGAYK